MDYDYLVIASGATTNYFGTKGAEENSRAIYTRSQALRLRDEIFTNLEHAAASNTNEDLAIVVVGAGPTGVEMAGALAELRNDAMAVDLSRAGPAAHAHRAGRDGATRCSRRSRRRCASTPPRRCASAASSCG